MTSPARAPDALVQPRRRQAPGVVDELDARVVRRETAEDLARRVEAHPVGDEDLEAVARPVLRLDGAKEGLDVLLLVEARHRDRDERVGHARRQYRAQAARFSSHVVTSDQVRIGASRPTRRSMWPSGNARYVLSSERLFVNPRARSAAARGRRSRRRRRAAAGPSPRSASKCADVAPPEAASPCRTCRTSPGWRRDRRRGAGTARARGARTSPCASRGWAAGRGGSRRSRAACAARGRRARAASARSASGTRPTRRMTNVSAPRLSEPRAKWYGLPIDAMPADGARERRRRARTRRGRRASARRSTRAACPRARGPLRRRRAGPRARSPRRPLQRGVPSWRERRGRAGRG